MNWGCEQLTLVTLLVVNLLLDHVSAGLGDFGSIGGLAVLIVLRLLEFLLAAVLEGDLIFNELVELAGAVHTSLSVHHLGLHQDLLLLLTVALHLGLLVALLLLSTRLRVKYEALDAVRQGVFYAELLFLPLKRCE